VTISKKLKIEDRKGNSEREMIREERDPNRLLE
jgi:hypothetical protein